MKKLYIGLVIIVGIIALGIIGYSLEMGGLYKEGLELQQKGEYNLALDKYIELVSKDPNGIYGNKALESVKEMPEEYRALLSSKMYEWGKEKQQKGDSYNAKWYYKSLLDLHSDSEYASKASTALNDLTPQRTDQKSAKKEWRPPNPGALEHAARSSNKASQHAARISDKASQIGQEHDARMNQLTKDIAARNAKIDQWSEEHNTRMNQLTNDIAARNAKIDQWSKEHNARMNALEGDIAARNAEIYEASIRATEHINELNKLTNDCLNDLLHMYANIGMGLCGIPGSVLSIMTTPYEFKFPLIKYLGKVPGSVGKIQMVISGNFMIVVINEGAEIAIRISQNAEDIGERHYKITNDFVSNIKDPVSHMRALSEEYDEIASKKSKSIEDTERMNELVVELTDQNNRIVEYMQDYNNQTNELIAEINQMIEEEMET